MNITFNKAAIFAAITSAILPITTMTYAQTNPADLRAIIGGSIDVEEAALFAASRTSYKQFCMKTPKDEVYANVINRLNYGSLEIADKTNFKNIMETQQYSNLYLFQGMGIAQQEAFCEGLDRYITSKVAAFVQMHPDLFQQVTTGDTETNGEGPTERIDAIMATHSLQTRLRILSKTEGLIFSDFKRIVTDDSNIRNPSMWPWKVLSIDMSMMSAAAKDFPLLSSIYHDRSKIYSRFIRGEITIDATGELEAENAVKAKLEYTSAHEKSGQDGFVIDNDILVVVDEAAKELSTIMIGTAKRYISTLN